MVVCECVSLVTAWLLRVIIVLVYSDRDECSQRGGRHGHHCHSNTVCVNTPGSFECQCLPGFSRIDQFTCQGNHGNNVHLL